RAPWLLCGWALLAWLLLSLVRVSTRPARYACIALVAWAIAGASSGLIAPGSGLPLPAWAWAALAAAGVACRLVARLRARGTAPPPAARQRNVLALSLPMFVLCVGAGWWLVFDLAFNGNFRNRYIALGQSLSVFMAFVLLTLMPALAQPLARRW